MMTKTDIQAALLGAYVKRDSGQEQVDSANKEIAALRNMLGGIQIAEQAASAKDKEASPKAHPVEPKS